LTELFQGPRILVPALENALSPDPEVLTFGCRLNSFESEIIRKHACAAGLEDAVVLNTCAVTGEAVRDARKAVRRARREHPTAEIIVTGCGAQISPELFAAMPEVDRVIGNAEKLQAESYVSLEIPRPRVEVAPVSELREIAPQLIAGIAGRTRAFVQVQNGCDHSCTFCIIPQGRGASRSVPIEQAVLQVQLLVAGGHREVVLTGVDATSYGSDLPGRPALGDLAAGILEGVPELDRLRLSSVDVAELDDTLLGLIAEEPRFTPYLHLSLQSGDDLILKRMKRRHSRAQAVEACAQLRGLRPDILFGADLIAGFPTESDEMFDRSEALIDDCGLSFLHVFPYSPREGTPAARLPELPRPVVKERAARLRAAGARSLARSLDGLVGSEQEVLVERDGKGRIASFAEAEVPAGVAAPGDLLAVRIEGHDGTRLSTQAI
jgi:threonylcarbamoyladenosine tRNA methylthiotransferase MtaB